MAKYSAKRELTFIVAKLKNVKVTSARIGTRDGIKMAFVNEEIRRGYRYQVVQIHRSTKTPFVSMYLDNRLVGTLAYYNEHNIEIIKGFLNRHEEISYFELYMDLI